jgi:SsrA-binding protein
MSAEITINRKARRDYHVLERFEAGVELKGTEVKSIRAGHVSLQGAFARIHGGEAWLHDCAIQPYQQASHEQHETKRPRRLLLHRPEIDKLTGAVEREGLALPVLRLYWKKGRVKAEIGLGKGKHAADKRHDLKKRVETREAERAAAAFNKRGGR